MDTDKNIFSVNGKVAIVIGAARGIGNSIAQIFGENGGSVMMADFDENELNKKADELRNRDINVDHMKVDIRNSKDLSELAKKTIKKFGRIDAAYITPGINIRKRFLDYSEEEFEKVIEINLKGNFLAMREIGKSMVDNPNGGSIVVLSSIRSVVVEPGQSVYASTKAGLVQLVRGLASELGNHNIRVNAIAPGVVDTPLTQQIKNDDDWYKAYRDKSALRRWATVEEIAGPAVFLATPAASFIDGTVIFIDGGWTAIDGRFSPKM